MTTSRVSASGHLLKGTVAHWASNLLAILLNLYTSVILTRTLGPELYGSSSLLFWIMGASVTYTQLAFPLALGKLLAELYGANKIPDMQGLLYEAWRGLVLSWGLGLMVLGLLATIGWPAPQFGIALWGALAVGFMLLSLNAVLSTCLYACQCFSLKPILDSISLVAFAGLVTTFRSSLHNLSWLMFLYSAPLVIPIVTALAMLSRRGLVPEAPVTTTGLRVRWIRFGSRLSIASLFEAMAYQRTELMLLGIFSGPREAGFYNLGSSIASVSRRLSSAPFMNLLLPHLASQASEPAVLPARTWRSMKALILVSFPVAAMSLVVARPVFDALYGPAYTSAIIPFQLLMLASPWNAAAYPVVCHLQCLERTRPIIVYQFLAAVVLILGCLLAIPRLGAAGAAVAAWVAQFIACASAIGYGVVRLKIPVVWAWIGKIALLSCGAWLCCWLTLRLVPATWAPLARALTSLACGSLAYLFLVLINGEWRRFRTHEG